MEADPRSTRRSSYIIAKYTVRQGTYRDVIKNISASGLSIRTSRRLSVGQSIELEFPLLDFDKVIQVSGKVIRREYNGFAVAFDKPLDDMMDKEGQSPKIVHEGDRSTQK